MIRDVHPGSWFFTHPGSRGVKKAPDPGSGSATLDIGTYPRERNTDPKSPLMCCLGAGKPVAAAAACRHLEFGGTAAATTDQSARRIWVAGFPGPLCTVLQAGHWEKRQNLRSALPCLVDSDLYGSINFSCWPYSKYGSGSGFRCKLYSI